MIHGRVVGGDALIRNTALLGPAMMDRLRQVVARVAVEMVARVKGDKLSDQVLHVRTGRLRRSITFKLTNGPTTATAQVGTNVSYARAHEYGFTGAVSVRAHLRKSKTGGKPAVVAAHTRQVKLPERSFLRSTLAEMKADIVRRMTDAVLANGEYKAAGHGVKA